ncbi:glycosyltransferase family 4 protein [Nocardioides gilvus]|uniref:glycosyltransferase family 4 protein n=1 Tax=Nocardioides gilvus TaxID=1735589 RepID=UPI000D748AFD|nr:glycosyltransferase family 4 protein [Nocardioides gilvus]
MTEPVRLSVVYPHLPHYRYGVFAALAADPRLDVTYVADDFESTGTIETIPLAVVPSVEVRNVHVRGLLWQHGLMRAVGRGRPDAVIFLGDASYLSTWVLALLLRLRRVPVFFWTIGWHRPETGVKRFIRMAFYRLADGLLLYGDWGVALGESHGYPGSRLFRVGNSRTSSMAEIPMSAAETERLRSGLEGMQDDVVAAIVRLNPTKRLDLLVDAAGILKRRGTPTTLLVVGDGPERDRLERQAAELGVDARFLGALYSEEALAQVYAAADLTVLPSAAGLTVIQSLEHGTPVVTHDDPHQQMPEAEAVRPGVTGDTFRVDDAEDLARVMKSWFGGRARTAAVAEACRGEAAERWSPESQAECIAQVVLAAVRKDRVEV